MGAQVAFLPGFAREALRFRAGLAVPCRSVSKTRFRAGPYLKRTPFPCRAFLGLSFDDDWAFLGLSFAPPPGGQKRGRL